MIGENAHHTVGVFFKPHRAQEIYQAPGAEHPENVASQDYPVIAGINRLDIFRKQ